MRFHKGVIYIKTIIGVRQWWRVIFNHFHKLSQGITTISFRSGKVFYCRANTSDMSEVVVVNLAEEYPLTYLSSIPQGAIALDIGAHIGSFSVHLATFRPDLTVFALEPAKSNFDLLRKNLEANKISSSQVIPLNIAVGSETGTGCFDLAGDTDAWHLADERSQSVNSDSLQEVEVITLADLKKRYDIKRIDFIKMDIEGGEYQVLETSRDILAECEIILLEFHETPYSIKKYGKGETFIMTYLSDLGFHTRRIRSNVIAGSKVKVSL